jgi:hypothetical protein
MIARLGNVLYWCGLAIASLCEIAAVAILVMVITKTLSASDAWISVAFFAIVGGAFWLAGRAAKYVLAGT